MSIRIESGWSFRMPEDVFAFKGRIAGALRGHIDESHRCLIGHEAFAFLLEEQIQGRQPERVDMVMSCAGLESWAQIRFYSLDDRLLLDVETSAGLDVGAVMLLEGGQPYSYNGVLGDAPAGVDQLDWETRGSDWAAALEDRSPLTVRVNSSFEFANEQMLDDLDPTSALTYAAIRLISPQARRRNAPVIAKRIGASARELQGRTNLLTHPISDRIAERFRSLMAADPVA